MAKLRLTRSAAIGREQVSQFPLILNNDSSVAWLALKYFLDLRRQGVGASSISTYAAHITDAMSQLEVDGRTIWNVSDGWLQSYRHALLTRNDIDHRQVNTENYASQVLRTVVNFLYWLEAHEYIRGVVGKTAQYPVRITQSARGIQHGLVKINRGGTKKFGAPQSGWINVVKLYGPKRDDLAERFELMIEWAASLGLRAAELCHLEIGQLPGEDSADKALYESRNLQMRIVFAKGRKQSNVPVSPLLVKKTWNYIHGSREKITAKHKRRARTSYKVFRDPGWVFLSDLTGDRLEARAFSNSVRSAFLKAVDSGELTLDERVWVHGLRHNFTVNLLRKLDEKGVKRAEAVARQVTRHGSEDAMAPYLTDRFNDSFDG